MVRKGKHLKSMTSKGGDSVRTLTVSTACHVLYMFSFSYLLWFPQSFLSDDDNVNFFEDASWMEAEELTTSSTSHILQNINFDDTTAEDSGPHLELTTGGNQLVVKPVIGQETSNF